MPEKATTDVSAANAEEVLRREFVDLAFNRLRLDRTVSPNEVERAMRLIDSGAMDGLIHDSAPVEQPPSNGEMYIDVKPFSYIEWKKRHGVNE